MHRLKLERLYLIPLNKGTECMLALMLNISCDLCGGVQQQQTPSSMVVLPQPEAED